MLHIEYSNYLYVFWVKTGQEEKAAEEIKTVFWGKVIPLLLTIETFFRKQGKIKKETHIAFPGYVFVSTTIKNDDFIRQANEHIHSSRFIIRLLCYGNSNEAVLNIKERAIIEDLWQGNCCIETSVGFIQGDRIVITNGPLIGKESIIKEIHPRRRQATIELEFMGAVRSVTVGLEILDKLP